MKKKDTTSAKTARVMPRKKVEEKVPKIEPLLGYLRTQYIKCGRSSCHCLNSKGHGPYYYRVVTVDGRKRKIYVKKSDLLTVRAGINERRSQLVMVRQINQGAKQNWRLLKSRLRELGQLMRLAGYDL